MSNLVGVFSMGKKKGYLYEIIGNSEVCVC